MEMKASSEGSDCKSQVSSTRQGSSPRQEEFSPPPEQPAPSRFPDSDFRSHSPDLRRWTLRRRPSDLPSHKAVRSADRR